MNARILTAATFATAFAVVLPASPADPQLLSLVMPDAVAVAGVNVEQAKNTPFGQYILSQFPTQDPHLQQLTAQTGFDPTRDVHELLAASNSVGNAHKGAGLLLARGAFDPSRIAALAAENGSVSEPYKGISILEDPKQMQGVAFLNATLAVAGDVASVKAAIDRQSSPTSLPSSLLSQINQWSNSQDAWAVCNVPFSSLSGGVPGTASIPGLNPGQGGAFQTIQSGAGGVKFGNQVVITGQAVSDNATDAKTLSDSLKLLASLAQLNAQKDPAASAVLQTLNITNAGSTVNVSLTVPEDMVQQFVHPKTAAPATRRPVRKM